jgi:hypothetical protein
MTHSSPAILIAMPLFAGWDHVGETLESIRRQSYENYRLLISVDGGDRRSYDECLKFAVDSRVELVLHEERLGWAGNMNWLGGQLREDYFCYWQHDDYCLPEYLKVLVDHAQRHPQAASVYCDMQRVGTRGGVIRHKSVKGFALERVLQQGLRANPAVIRCLIRQDALRASLPINLASTWTIALASAGELHRIPQILYFRRMRDDSLGVQMLARPEAEMLDVTVEQGLGFIKYLHPLLRKDEHGRMLAMVADQLVNQQSRGHYQIDFASADPLLRDEFRRRLFDMAVRQFGLEPSCAEEARREAEAPSGYFEPARKVPRQVTKRHARSQVRNSWLWAIMRRLRRSSFADRSRKHER